MVNVFSPKPAGRLRRGTAGFTLVEVLIAGALLAVLISGSVTALTQLNRWATAARLRTLATAVAQQRIDLIETTPWQVVGTRPALLTATTTTENNVPLNNDDYNAATSLITPYTTLDSQVMSTRTTVITDLTTRTPLLAPTTDGAGRPTPENGTNSQLRVRLYYLATVTIQYYVPSAYRSITLQRAFTRSGRNLFDNFFFGTQPKIEFHPGAPMYVSGTAYVGGDLYTAHDYLHFTKDVTYTGTHTLDYRPEDSRIGTAPTITNGGLGDNWDLNNPPRYGSQQKLLDTSVASLDPNFTDDPRANDADSDGNNNNDGLHEIIEEQKPIVGTTNPDPLQLDSATSERLASNADYRITVDATNNVSIYKGTATSQLGASDPEYLAILAALTPNRGISDAREGGTVRVVVMDVSKITAAYVAGKIFDTVSPNGTPDGLLFYFNDTSAGTSVGTVSGTGVITNGVPIVDSSTGATAATRTGVTRRGIKLVKGATLPTCGLSIVTPNSAYIQGDFNTGTTASVQPASNTTTTYTPPVDNPSPIVTGYNRAASAVVADAVNVLSNAWNDANSLLGTSSRLATSTTINTAIVAGNVPTVAGGSYSGGIENFARFHEDWSNDFLTIYGALALLYNSEQATGPWISAQYRPPNRRWYYDTLLQDHNPPGFRAARTYERGQWVSR